jgi:hypothetical protein
MARIRAYDRPMGVLQRIGRPGRAALLLAVGAAGGGVALAVASVPDGSGVVHACYQVGDPGQTQPLGNQNDSFRVIDPGAGQHCNTAGDEAPLNWNAQGPRGPQGPPGGAGPPGTGNTFTATLVSPRIKNSDSPVGRLQLGTGRSALKTKILAFAVAHSGSAAKVAVHDISITKKENKASPLLFKFCATGKHFKKATLVVRKAGKGQQEFLVIKMTDVIISSAQSHPSGGGAAKPQESLSLNFTKIEFK